MRKFYYYDCSCTTSTDFPDSLAIHLYNSLLPAGPLDYILCQYRAVVDKLLLVNQHLHVDTKGFIGECCL